jgi:mono/diheme cytochrome c family protein
MVSYLVAGEFPLAPAPLIYFSWNMPGSRNDERPLCFRSFCANSIPSGRALLAISIFLGVVSLAWAKLTPEQASRLPPVAGHSVSFSKEIRPILEASCTRCHGRGRNKGDFRLDTRETLLKGGESGPAILPGKSGESYLIELVSGLDPENTMPRKGKKLTPEEVGLLRAWIDQGAPWDAEVFFGKAPPRNFTPRRPELPPVHGALSNPIDRLLARYFETNHVQSPKPVSDGVFARRAYLDLIGLLPSAEETRKFAAERSAQKRQRLVDRLLADNQRYAEHWLTFWNDALRNDYKGTGYIDGGRKQITDWLFAALARNLPYDQFVAQLVNPSEECEGFTKGIVWRGAVNASQVPPMQAAQNISQVFMGVNLKCASCHDSFINDWKLSDAYGLANIYSDTQMELFECDKPTGKKATTQFIFPELGNIDTAADRPARLKQLAAAITNKENGRLSRTIVNRLWQKFFGRGLVEPADDMEQPAWNTDLLDWLAEDLVEHGYDVKHTIRQMLTSRAYQLPAVSLSETRESEFVFRGPAVRRMSAEQFRDALAMLTGNWYARPATAVDVTAGERFVKTDGAHGVTRPTSESIPKWIWNNAGAAHHAAEGTVYFRSVIRLPERPTEAFLVAACDNSFTLYINGKKAASGKDWNKLEPVDIAGFLIKGKNTIAVQAVNGPAEANEKDAKDQKPTVNNPAGFICQARVRYRANRESREREKIMDFASDGRWLCSTNHTTNWQSPEFKAEGWLAAAELGDASLAPWSIQTKLTTAIGSTAEYGRTRAALVAADPLMVALGRPNREQVITARSSAATTLQMLELENGQTLFKVLERGADHLLSEKRADARDLIEQLYQGALGRLPTGPERELAQELIGQPARKEGLEDFLWALAMLPEFQLIY